MKLLITLFVVLAGAQTEACQGFTPAEQDLKAVHSIFQKASQLIRSQHPDSSLVKMELKIRSTEPEVLHYMTVFKNEESQTCDAYYISAVQDENCQFTSQVGAKLNLDNRCQAL